MNELVQDIRTQLHATPAVDVHSHLGNQGICKARHLADLVSYHWIMLELRRAGADLKEQTIDDPDAYMEKVAPYFSAIRNTSNHYVLHGMLRDLYGFEDRTITPENWRALDEKVRAAAKDENRLNHVLDKGGIRLLPIAYTDGFPEGFDNYFAYAFGEDLFAGSTTKRLRSLREKTEALTGTSMPELKTMDALKECIETHVKILRQRYNVKAFHIWIRDNWYYERCHNLDAQDYLSRIWKSQTITTEEDRKLISATADMLADAAGAHGMTLQLFHGMDFYMGTNVAGVNSYWNPDFMRSMPRFADAHPDTQLDIFLATRIPSHEAASIARSNRNLSVSGGWWHGFTPSALVQFFNDRLEFLPHTAWNAFFSDGYIIEWVYAKSLLTKNCLARALAQQLQDGYIIEEDIPEIARNLLHDNALKIYGLSE